MKKRIEMLLTIATCCATLLAVVRTELQMHVFRNGDNGENMFAALSEVDSVKFTYDTLRSKLYTSEFFNYNGELFATLENCSFDSVLELKPSRDTTASCIYTFREWKRDESEIAENKLTYIAVYDSTIRKYAVAFIGEPAVVYGISTFDYGTMPVCSTNPTKESTELYDFTFKDWDPTLVEVTNDTVYRAVFNSKKHPYTYMFYNCGNLFAKVDGGALDSMPKVATPTREPAYFSYEFKKWLLDSSKVAKDTLVYIAVYDSVYDMKRNGAIRSAFKVSDTTSVYFSQGNLQFNAIGTHATMDGTAQGVWQFAENQYDVIGLSNRNISETYDGWIDLFAWGTSGWSGGVTAYQPWSTVLESKNYYLGGIDTLDMVGEYAKADWGVFNAIQNGGDTPNMWRTLTIDEWKYLINNTQWTIGYVKTSDVDSIFCCFLLPEGFTMPNGLNMKVIKSSVDKGGSNSSYDYDQSDYKGNTITVDQFKTLEELGVVVLPCGGRRSETSVIFMNNPLSFYWSSTSLESFAYYLIYMPNRLYISSFERCNEISVRLVQEIR